VFFLLSSSSSMLPSFAFENGSSPITYLYSFKVWTWGLSMSNSSTVFLAVQERLPLHSIFSPFFFLLIDQLFLIFYKLFFFLIFFFYCCDGWGYIVAFIQGHNAVLTMCQVYHTWIHLLNHSPSTPLPWFL
jgi:hypothetical protein